MTAITSLRKIAAYAPHVLTDRDWSALNTDGIARFPTPAAYLDRLAWREEREQAVKDARATLRTPFRRSDDVLAEACRVLQDMGDATDYAEASAMLMAVAKRSRQNAAVPDAFRETSAQVFARHWRAALPWAVMGAAVILAVAGWL